jgi:peptidoglycan/LPS O-acetylase OafA/YrhL
MGMLSAHMAYRPNLRVGTVPWIAAAISAVAFVAAGFACVQDFAIYQRDAFIGVAVSALCYLITVTEEGYLCRSLAWKPLVGLGAFSYSLYLMHHPIEQVIFAIRPGFVSSPEAIFFYLLLVGTPIVLAGTWLFSLVFERPFITRRDAVDPEPVYRGLTPLSLPLKTYRRAEPERSHPPKRDEVEYGERSVATVS